MISKKKRKKDTKLINDKKIIISIINISNYLLYYCVILFKILKFYEIYKSFYIIDTSIVFMILVISSLFLNIFTVTFETEWSSNCTCALLRQLNYEVLEVINEDLDIIYIHLFLNKKNHNISKYNIIFTNYSI